MKNKTIRNQKPVPLILEVSENSTLITSVLKNAEGVILSKESYYVEAPAQQVLEETAMKYEKAPNTEVRINP
jgi:hypothetical protein